MSLAPFVSQVGILFFLFEFFSDQLLAFMVLSVVWLCEVYSVVSVRTSMSIRFFPQVGDVVFHYDYGVDVDSR